MTLKHPQATCISSSLGMPRSLQVYKLDSISNTEISYAIHKFILLRSWTKISGNMNNYSVEIEMY